MAAAAGARAQVGEGALEDVQGTEGVCGELGADFVVVLVFAGAYYSYREWGRLVLVVLEGRNRV